MRRFLKHTFTPVSQSPEKHISVVAGLGPGHSWSIKIQIKVNHFLRYKYVVPTITNMILGRNMKYTNILTTNLVM